MTQSARLESPVAARLSRNSCWWSESASAWPMQPGDPYCGSGGDADADCRGRSLVSIASAWLFRSRLIWFAPALRRLARCSPPACLLWVAPDLAIGAAAWRWALWRARRALDSVGLAELDRPGRAKPATDDYCRLPWIAYRFGIGLSHRGGELDTPCADPCSAWTLPRPALTGSALAAHYLSVAPAIPDGPAMSGVAGERRPTRHLAHRDGRLGLARRQPFPVAA